MTRAATRSAPPRRSGRASLGVAFLLVAVMAGGMGQALAASRLLVPYPAVAGAFAPFFIAKELGLFSRHDLQVDLVFVSGAGKATMLLVGGTSPLVVTSGTATIGANLVGADLIIVAGNP